MKRFFIILGIIFTAKTIVLGIFLIFPDLSEIYKLIIISGIFFLGGTIHGTMDLK